MCALGPRRFLIDCGASSLIGMRRLGLRPDAIDTVFVTHLHGDHFGGLPWLLVDAVYVSNRTRPLVVTGPKGIAARFVTAAEALYPGITTVERAFDLNFIEYEEQKPVEVGGVTVVPFEVRHPSGAPPYALRSRSTEGARLHRRHRVGRGAVPSGARRGSLHLGVLSIRCRTSHPPRLRHHRCQLRAARGKARAPHPYGEAMLAAAERSTPCAILIAHDGMTLDL